MTVSQCADSIEKLFQRRIEGIMTKRQMKQLAEKLASDIDLTQERKEGSRISATRRRERDLKLLGIDIAQLASCQFEDLTL